MCEFLYEQAKLFQLQNELEIAIKSVQKSKEISEEVERRDYVFKSKLLIAELVKNKKEALNTLENLTKMIQNNEEKAEYLFTHFKLTKNKDSAKKAIVLFEKLYKKAPKIFYKQRLESLQKMLENM